MKVWRDVRYNLGGGRKNSLVIYGGKFVRMTSTSFYHIFNTYKSNSIKIIAFTINTFTLLKNDDDVN